jgi:FkbM family methyltransferase
MRRSLIRYAVQTTLGRFGLQLVKTTDCFAMQVKLTGAAEPVIFDIGAADGGVAELYRQLFPHAEIHCFEPFPKAFEALQRRLGTAPRTHCVGRAVADREGTSLLHANVSSATNSLLATDDRSTAFWGDGLFNTEGQVEVKTTSLDAYCAQAGVNHVDILKIDVQGAEWGVLQGARELLSSQRVALVYTELITSPTYRGQHKLHEYLSFFDSMNYTFVDFYNPVRKHGKLLQADAIFVANSAAAQ